MSSLENKNMAFAKKDALEQYLELVAKTKLMPDEEVIKLAKIMQEGAIAKRRILNAHQRLVVELVDHYAGRGVSRERLIEMGNKGLKSALERYDPDKGFEFKTYATWFIKQYIMRELCN